MLIIIAICKLKSKTGIKKVNAKINFEINVDIVDSQIDFSFVFLEPASSDICTPKESEKASAIAIVKIPPKTTIFEPVEEAKPIIKPRVVIIPEVKPKPTPFLIAISIKLTSKFSLKIFQNKNL